MMIVYVRFVNDKYQVRIDRGNDTEVTATFRTWNEADDYAFLNYRGVYIGRM